MINLVDVIGEQLREFRDAKKKNFGSIPEDFKEMIESILSHEGPAQYFLMSAAQAATSFPEFVQDIKTKMLGNGVEEEKVGEQMMSLAVDMSKIHATQLIRDNWDLCENAFRMLYIGIKIGRMQEREEHDSLERLARMEKNPNAFDSVGPDTPAPTSLADVKLSPEKEAIFKAELQDALQQQRHKRDKKGDTSVN